VVILQLHPENRETIMAGQFTLHCVAWKNAAPLLLEARTAACRNGLLSPAEAQTEEADEFACHAMVLNDSGKAIGCARIQPAGNLERMVVLDHEDQVRIAQALQLAAWLQSRSLGQCA
jgi:hypothetical protein